MKKIPMRRCICCMESKPKNQLYRIVKNSDNVVILDKSGKASGRGTYICSLNCLNKAIKTKKIDKELDIKIEDNVYEQLIVDLNTYIK